MWSLTISVLTLLSLIWSANTQTKTVNADNISYFQSYFNAQEIRCNELLDEVMPWIESSTDLEFKDIKRNLFLQEYNEGIVCIVYYNDSLIFWSSNESSFPSSKHEIAGKNDQLVFLGNAYYFLKQRSIQKIDVIGLIKIKNQYVLNNHLLVNEFNPQFPLQANIEINNHKDGLSINSINDAYAFSLKDTLNHNQKSPLSAILFFLCILSFLNVLYVFFYDLLIEKKKSGYWFLITCVGLLLFYWSSLSFPFLKPIYLFSPSLFAVSDLLPSLGHLLLLAILIFFAVYSYFKLGVRAFIKYPHYGVSRYALYAIYAALNLFTAQTFRDLIYHSNISFVAYRANEVSQYTFLGLLVVSLLISASLIILFMTIRYEKGGVKHSFFWTLVMLILTHAIYFGLQEALFPFAFLFFMVGFWLLIFLNKKSWTLNISKAFILIAIAAAYAVIIVISETNKKEKTRMELLAEEISDEQDFQAEILLKNLAEDISMDTFLLHQIKDSNYDLKLFEDYIGQIYLTNYLSKYQAQVGICLSKKTTNTSSFYSSIQCAEYEQLRVISNAVMDSPFYYRKNIDGLISYVGVIEMQADYANLYLELKIKDIQDNLGYPELLMNNKSHSLPYSDAYSYARYYQGKLISQQGMYAYNSVISEGQSKAMRAVYEQNDYVHTSFFLEPNEVILISYPRRTWMDIVFTFSYLYMFFALSVFSFVLIFRTHIFFGSLSLRNKIQYSMISILLLSFVLIGGITVYLSLRQYENRQKQFISEKIKSVSIELEHKLKLEVKLNQKWETEKYRNLEALLKKFSQVFFTDINLYAPSGKLLASSRSEIFENQLISDMMEPEAFYEMHEKKSTEYIHNERIGKLSYLSGYYPFYNHDQKLLAYLNLPYFTKQKAFTQELSTLLVAIINIYVLLFLLTSVMAFVVSEQLTRPISLIQASFKQVKLGVKNALIEYNRNDEIKELVNEYNRMMLELSASAEKLAKSEREGAWREMAKQIAHEIKNPLTPMKLNIQQLERSWDPNNPEWRNKFKKVTQILIEQIDSLSAIASEFSNFAKMSDNQTDDVELIQKVKGVVSLFENTQNISIQVKHDGIKKVAIYANHEQILRVFNNIIKNSIQAIPKGVQGRIDIVFEMISFDVVRVCIQDNGAGVDEKQVGKLFQPNFTTKTSGTGLGLAIVQKIINNTQGQVAFDLSFENGAMLVIEWPISDITLG